MPVKVEFAHFYWSGTPLLIYGVFFIFPSHKFPTEYQQCDTVDRTDIEHIIGHLGTQATVS